MRGHKFVLIDDDIHLYENARLNPPSLKKWERFWTGPTLGLYIPVTYSVWTGAALISGRDELGLRPWAFHVLNLVLHALNVVLVFWLFRELLPLSAARDWGAAAGALCFAVHPVQVEPVAWASGAKDLLCAFFGWLALWLFFRRARSSRPGWMYALSTLAFALALLSKPSGLVLPAMVLCLAVLFLRQPWKPTVIALVPWAALALPIVFLTKGAQPDRQIEYITPLLYRPLIAGDAIAFYLGKIGFPLFLVPDYSRNPQFVMRHTSLLVAWIVPFLALWLMRRKAPWLIVPFALVVIGVFPVLGWVPFYFQAFSTVSDRFLYLGMLGPSLATALVVARSERRWPKVMVGLALAAAAWLSFVQQSHWRDTPQLLSYNLLVNPESVLAHNNLGAYLEAHGDLKGALEHYEATLKIQPLGLPPQYNAARVLGRLGRYAEADRRFTKVLAQDPLLAEGHFSLGIVKAHEGKVDEAGVAFQNAVKLRPKMAKGHLQLGNYYLIKGKRKEAEAEFQTALRLEPAMSPAQKALDTLRHHRARALQSLSPRTASMP